MPTKKRKRRVSIKAVFREIAGNPRAPATARMNAARGLQRMKGKRPQRSHEAGHALVFRALELLRDDDPDQIPIVEFYKGVGLHDQQMDERLSLVRSEIDAVFGMDALACAAWAEDDGYSPESRLLAVALCQARVEAAKGRAATRAGVDVKKAVIWSAGLNCERWRSATHYGSMLQPCRNAVARPVALPDA